DAQSDERLAKVTDEMGRTEGLIATARGELAAAGSTLRAKQAIAPQPDWSILLALLGNTVGDDVVLKSCRVRPTDPSRAPARQEPRRAAPAPSSRAQARPAAPGSQPPSGEPAPLLVRG